MTNQAAVTTSASFALQACSILYKTQLPLLLVFNKTDVRPHEFALEWMRDSDSFNEALDTDTSYASQLSRSLSLVSLYSPIYLYIFGALEIPCSTTKLISLPTIFLTCACVSAYILVFQTRLFRTSPTLDSLCNLLPPHICRISTLQCNEYCQVVKLHH